MPEKRNGFTGTRKSTVIITEGSDATSFEDFVVASPDTGESLSLLSVQYGVLSHTSPFPIELHFATGSGLTLERVTDGKIVTIPTGSGYIDFLKFGGISGGSNQSIVMSGPAGAVFTLTVTVKHKNR